MPGEPWLILPTYNEADNVEAIMNAAGEVLVAAAPEGFRILVVDDGSPDGTGADRRRDGRAPRVGAGAAPHREGRHRAGLSGRFRARARRRERAT